MKMRVTTKRPPKKISAEILESIQNAQRIVIISHRHPDADTIGCNLALSEWLRTMQKSVTSACIDDSPKDLQYLTKHLNYAVDFDLKKTDLIITVDCSSTEQAGFFAHKPGLKKFKSIINIDHHQSNPGFGALNLVMKNSSSTAEIIFQLFEMWQVKINAKMATGLLSGLYFDTGSFMHTNTSATSLEMAEKLIQAGAKHHEIIQNLFHNFTQAKFNLWGEVLSNFKINEKHAAVSAITEDDIKNCDASDSDGQGVIDYLCSTEDCNFAMLLNQGDKNIIKGSLRTKNEKQDMSRIAQKFQGGGHKKASGFSLPGKLQKQTYWRIEK